MHAAIAQVHAARLMAADLDQAVVLADIGVGVHVLLEVQVQELEHQVQPIVRMDNILQPGQGTSRL